MPAKPESRLTKVLVIGATGLSMQTETDVVHSILWEAVGFGASPRDYDVLLLDVLEKRPGERNTKFSEVFDARLVEHVLGHGGTIVVLGDPRFLITDWMGGKKNFLDWTGFWFTWTSGPGDVLLAEDNAEAKRFLPYLRHVKVWSYSLSSVQPYATAMGMLRAAGNPAERVGAAGAGKVGATEVIETARLASTRFGEPIASIHWRVKRDVAGKITSRLGPLILLPKSSLSHEDALRSVLVHGLGVELETPAPAWVERAVPFSKETGSKRRIEEIEQRLREEADRLGVLQAQLSAAGRFRRLLYDTGESLEQIVREALSRLGASVTEPVAPGKEDGWISLAVRGVPTEAVLEIKATRNDHFGEEGIRQLLDWANRGVVDHKKHYKPLFIGNSAIARSPNERADPFGASWRETASIANVAAILTEDLYRALLLDERGELDRDRFWEETLNSKGPANLQFLRNQLQSVVEQ